MTIDELSKLMKEGFEQIQRQFGVSIPFLNAPNLSA